MKAASSTKPATMDNAAQAIYRNQPLAGALFMISASLLIALVGAVVKNVSSSLNNEMIVFLRNLFVMLCVLPLIRR
jgi:FtsH-binding integral membrane protein